MDKLDPLDKDRLLNLETKYEAELANNPESNSFCQLAEVQLKLGKIDKATGVLIRGLTHDRNNVTARFLLGKIYYDRWLIDQAKKEMEKVLGIMPDNIEAAKLLSEIHISEANFDTALDILEGISIFHSEDEDLNKRVKFLKQKIGEIKSYSETKVFETPVESRKPNKITADTTVKSNIYTETMLNLYVKQGEYEKALETINHLYVNEEEKKSAIEKLQKTKLNKMNSSAGFVSGD